MNVNQAGPHTYQGLCIISEKAISSLCQLPAAPGNGGCKCSLKVIVKASPAGIVTAQCSVRTQKSWPY